MKKFWMDFKKFISKGNIMDLAVAVIIGAAFGKIVTSLVNDLLMPLISLLFTAIGLKGFADWKWDITDKAGNVTATMNYGAFIQSIIDFLIIALCIFVIFRLISSAGKKLETVTKKITEKNKKEGEAETPAETPAAKEPTTAELLTEIRDLLKAQSLAQAAAESSAAKTGTEADEKSKTAKKSVNTNIAGKISPQYKSNFENRY